MKNVSFLVSQQARMCFIIYQDLSCAFVCNEDHCIEKDCSNRRGGRTDNETAEMTQRISFPPVLAIRTCVCVSIKAAVSILLGKDLTYYLFSCDQDRYWAGYFTVYHFLQRHDCELTLYMGLVLGLKVELAVVWLMKWRQARCSVCIFWIWVLYCPVFLPQVGWYKAVSAEGRVTRLLSASIEMSALWCFVCSLTIVEPHFSVVRKFSSRT